MRTWLMAAVAFGFPMAFAASVQAAPVSLFEEFKAVCAANRLDPTKAISAAKARGYAVESGPEVAKIGTSTILRRVVEGRKWIVRVSVTGVPPSPVKQAETTSNCTVGGEGADPTALNSLRRWASVPALRSEPTSTTFAFRMEGERHLPLVSNDDAGVLAAMGAGGVYLVSLSTNPTNSVVTLSRTVSGF